MTSEGAASMAGTISNTNGNGVPADGRNKLHGRAFYESIGSPKFVLAPMVDQSEFVPLSSPFSKSMLM